MFLNYLSLFILLAGLTLVFYAFIYIHDIPYELAKKRNHPQTEAIHIACILSLFTLHALWPIVFLWATLKSGPMVAGAAKPLTEAERDALLTRIAALEKHVGELQSGKKGGH